MRTKSTLVFFIFINHVIDLMLTVLFQIIFTTYLQDRTFSDNFVCRTTQEYKKSPVYSFYFV